MAWSGVAIKTDNGEWKGQVSTTSSNPVFSIPATSGISDGDVFEADKKQYTAVKCVDLAQRGETILVEAKESKNDKPNARRTGSKSSGSDVQDTPND